MGGYVIASAGEKVGDSIVRLKSNIDEEEEVVVVVLGIFHSGGTRGTRRIFVSASWRGKSLNVGLRSAISKDRDRIRDNFPSPNQVTEFRRIRHSRALHFHSSMASAFLRSLL
jgi:hypothetical protein